MKSPDQVLREVTAGLFSFDAGMGSATFKQKDFEVVCQVMQTSIGEENEDQGGTLYRVGYPATMLQKIGRQGGWTMDEAIAWQTRFFAVRNIAKFETWVEVCRDLIRQMGLLIQDHIKRTGNQALNQEMDGTRERVEKWLKRQEDEDARKRSDSVGE